MLTENDLLKLIQEFEDFIKNELNSGENSKKNEVAKILPFPHNQDFIPPGNKKL